MKRMYKSRRRVFSGVCGGIAEYIKLDPNVVRIIVVLIGIFTGFFPIIIAYIAVACILPDAPRNRDFDDEMRHEN